MNLRAAFRPRVALEAVLVLGSLAALSYVSNRWILDAGNFFGLDDFDWFRYLQIHDGQPIFTLFPLSFYNDRPMGVMLIEFLRDRWGWDHVAHHVFLWALHLVNAGLVYVFARQLLDLTLIDGARRARRLTAWTAAAVFVAWPASTLVAPSWDAAIFDLLGATFLLLFLVTALALRDKRLLAFHATLLLVALWLGLRTKETLIVAPFIVVAIGLAVAIVRRWGQVREGIPVFARVAAGLCAVSVAYYFLLRLLNTQGFGTDPGNPYFQSFAPASLAANVAKYVALFFDFGIPDNLATAPVGARWLYYVLPAAMLLTAAWQFLKRDGVTIALCSVLALMQMAPVLPMKNMQHRLYLYLPSVFVAVAMAAMLAFLVDRLPRWRQTVSLVVAVAVSVVMTWSGYASSIWISRNWWLEVGRENAAVFPQLFELPHFPEKSRVAVVNVPDYMVAVSLFAPGGGEVLHLLDHDPSVTVKIYQHEVPAGEAEPPTHVIDYNHGRLVLRPQAPAPK